MFDDFKKLQELKKMHDELKKEKFTFEQKGISVTINGSFEIEELKLNPDLSVIEQENILKQNLNEARESVQKKLAQKMMASGIGF